MGYPHHPRRLVAGAGVVSPRRLDLDAQANPSCPRRGRVCRRSLCRSECRRDACSVVGWGLRCHLHQAVAARAARHAQSRRTTTVTACVQPLASRAPSSGGIGAPEHRQSVSSPPADDSHGHCVRGNDTAHGDAGVLHRSATCSYMNGEMSGHVSDAVPVTYTGPNPTAGSRPRCASPPDDRRVVRRGDRSVRRRAASAIPRPTSSRRLRQYQFSAARSPRQARLTAGQSMTYTITALDNSSTPHPVPGAFIDLSLSSTGGRPGTATAVNNFSMFTKARINNSPNRFGADANGQVVVTYTAPTRYRPGRRHDHRAEARRHTRSVIAATIVHVRRTSTPSRRRRTPPCPRSASATRGPWAVAYRSNQCDNATGAGRVRSCRAQRVSSPLTVTVARPRVRRHRCRGQRHGDRSNRGNPPHAVSRRWYSQGHRTSTRPAGEVRRQPRRGGRRHGRQDRCLQRSGHDQRRARHRGLCVLDVDRELHANGARRGSATRAARGRESRRNQCNDFSSAPHPIGPGGVLTLQRLRLR